MRESVNRSSRRAASPQAESETKGAARRRDECFRSSVGLSVAVSDLRSGNASGACSTRVIAVQATSGARGERAR